MPSVDAFEQVMAGQGGIASSNGKGQIVIECSTLPIDVKARGEVQLAAQGKILLDCPVSGTQPGEPVTAKRVVDQLVEPQTPPTAQPGSSLPKAPPSPLAP